MVEKKSARAGSPRKGQTRSRRKPAARAAVQQSGVVPLTLSSLSPTAGSTQSRKRVGRGPGSGLGKTSGKGNKGHKARTGGYHKPSVGEGVMSRD